MHELSICQALLSQLREIVTKHGADSVKRVVVAVGPLSGVDPALLATAFRMARTHGCAADADLCFEPTSVRVRCLQCRAETPCAANRLLCGQCGGYRTQVVSGDELRLLRVELVHDDLQRRPSSTDGQRSQPAM